MGKKRGKWLVYKINEKKWYLNNKKILLMQIIKITDMQ